MAKALKAKYKFIHFEKTNSFIPWLCKNTKHGDILGKVWYYDPWSQYIFDPNLGVVLSAECLMDIADFILQLHEAKLGMAE